MLEGWQFHTIVHAILHIWEHSCVICVAHVLDCNLSQLEICRSSPITEWHGDVIKWKHFPRYWPFVRGIHQSPVNSPHKVQWREALMFSLICALNKRLSKQSRGWWFETPSRPLWRHCNGMRDTLSDFSVGSVVYGYNEVLQNNVHKMHLNKHVWWR